MGNEKRPKNHHDRYHAHLYFEQETRSLATELSERVGAEFGLKVGRVHQKI